MKTQYFALWYLKHAARDRRAAVIGSPIPWIGGWFVPVPKHLRHGSNLTRSKAFA